jgi:hypothetical protein
MALPAFPFPDAMLPSPAFVVSLPKLKANCSRITGIAKAHGLSLRPHMKVGKGLGRVIATAQSHVLVCRRIRPFKVVCYKLKSSVGKTAGLWCQH